jgi:hypothetical protein
MLNYLLMNMEISIKIHLFVDVVTYASTQEACTIDFRVFHDDDGVYTVVYG